MKQQIRMLQKIVTRKGSSKVLTFSAPHVFKALQLLTKQTYVSRATFCDELHLGEGAIKTLISHLKEVNLVDSIKSGTFLTRKGKNFAGKFFDITPSNCLVKKCDITREKYNHARILKNYAHKIGNGMDQRDYAIVYGALGAITLAYKNGQFDFPGEKNDCLSDDQTTKQNLIEKLAPENGDIIIIASSDDSFVAEISVINSILWTLAKHE